MRATARYRVVHETHYRYASAVHLSRQLLHLTPRASAHQATLSHRIDVEPVPAEWHEYEDYFGNPVVQMAVHVPHRELRVRSESEVELSTRGPLPDPAASPPWEVVRGLLQGATREADPEAVSLVYESPCVQLTPGVLEYARASFPPGRPVVGALLHLTRCIRDEFEFDPEATSVSTPVREVLTRRRGVCQDFAHLQIACLRALGLAARYVSGYILTHPPPGRSRLVGADASHAWVSAWVPTLGWLDLDPTNDLVPDLEHVTLGFGRDFADVSPLRGVILGGGEHELEVRVDVAPLPGAGRP